MTSALTRIAIVYWVCSVWATFAVADPHRASECHAPNVPRQHGKALERFAAEMNEGMTKMMSAMHALGYSGDSDVDFLAMMIAHHEGAITMARLALQHGNDPTTRKLAEDIIASQQIEIEGMQRRLKSLVNGASRSTPDGYPVLGGTRGQGVGGK